MAGEAHITYGVGYSFAANPISEEDLQGLYQKHYFDGDRLTLAGPDRDSGNPRFAILARSTVYSGDPQEWSYSYGVQLLPKIQPEEFEAFTRIHAGLQKHYPAVAKTVSELGPVLFVTADR